MQEQQPFCQQSLLPAVLPSLCFYALQMPLHSSSAASPGVKQPVLLLSFYCFSPNSNLANCPALLTSASGTWAPKLQSWSPARRKWWDWIYRSLCLYRWSWKQTLVIRFSWNKSLQQKTNEKFKMNLPLITPMISGWGMADLMCNDCSYSALSFLLFFCAVYIWISKA